jgi:restriction endonuclease S subunit
MDSQAGSAQKFIRASQFNNMLISIPKSKQKITEWVNKISKPYDKKNKNEELIMKLEEQIRNKIKAIEENEECDIMSLIDICDIELGTRITKRDNIIGNIPVYGGGDISFYTNKVNRSENTLIVSRYALSKVCVRLIFNKFYLNDSGLSIKSKNSDLQNYINYYLLSSEIQEYIYKNCTSGSIQHNLNMNLFYNIKIKLPKNKQLIKDFEPLFQQMETLQTELKEAEELYKKLIKELSEEAIPSNKQIEEIKEIEEIEQIKVNKNKKKINETKNSEL